MRASEVAVGTFDALLREGVTVLVRAAEGGGAHRRKAPVLLPDGRRMQLSFQERICHLLNRYGLGSRGSSVAGLSASQIAQAVVGKMWTGGFQIAALTDDVTALRLKLLVTELSKAWKRGRRRVEPGWESPFSTLRASYLAVFRESMVRDVYDPWCLIAFALACRGIKEMHRCELCFRWAVPGIRFCHEHTQSIAGRGDSRARGARYRRAKRMLDGFESATRRMRLPMAVSAARLPRVIGRVLWDIGTVDDEAALDASVARLAACGRLGEAVLRADGDDLPWPRPAVLLDLLSAPGLGKGAAKRNRAQLWGALRELLDPLEWDPTNWPDKIKASDRWFGCVARRQPGHRGLGKSTSAKLAHAIFLADAGYSRKDVAREIGISVSALSNWSARFAVPGHPFERLITRLNGAFPDASALRRRERRAKALLRQASVR